MPAVVSDTSVIRALLHLNQLGLLPLLFKDVVVPPAVADQLANPRGAFEPIHLEAHGEVRVLAPTVSPQLRSEILREAGEA